MILQDLCYLTNLPFTGLQQSVAWKKTFYPVEHIPLFHSTIPFHHSSPVIVLPVLRPMLMEFMFQIKIFQNIDEGGRSSLSIMPLFLEEK